MSRPPQRQSIFVTVGTDHHPFDRLIRWVDDWAARNPSVAVTMQIGPAEPPEHAEHVRLLGYPDLIDRLGRATLVVGQAGPGTIMDTRSVGHKPIVVPRLAAHGEVVDDHQVKFARWVSGRGLAMLAEDEDALSTSMDRALADPTICRVAGADDPTAATVRAFAAVVDPLLDRRRSRTS